MERSQVFQLGDVIVGYLLRVKTAIRRSAQFNFLDPEKEVVTKPEREIVAKPMENARLRREHRHIAVRGHFLVEAHPATER